MRAYRGVVTVFMVAALALPGSSALAETGWQLGPVFPVPWWMIYPDLVIDAVSVSPIVKCEPSTSKTKAWFTVAIRNAGYKTAYIPSGGPFVRIQTIEFNPQTADLGYFYSLPAGQKKTLTTSLLVPYELWGDYTLLPGIRFYADPLNRVQEGPYGGENNNFREEAFLLPKCI
jgi:hypothetical protein